MWNWDFSKPSATFHSARKAFGRLLIALVLASIGSATEIRAAVVINEIHYDPDVKTELVEFIELFNTGTSAVDVAGWSLSEGVSFTFPAGTTIASGGYLVVAENPAALQRKFGVQALGPWLGRLSSEGETIVLRNGAGEVVDEVDYQLGFPWPTVGDPPGNSIELVNPALENDVGGSWRASGGGSAGASAQTLIAERSTWKYFKGTAEASSPSSAWRKAGFDDSGWLTGSTPIGYGENFLATSLSDMQGTYSSVFFRKTFSVADPGALGNLQLEALYDDGFNVWINGVLVLSQNMPGNEVAFNGTANVARESLNFETFSLPAPAGYLVAGENVLAIQAHNSSLSSSTDFFVDIRLKGTAGSSGRGPTPGARNSIYADNIPPQIRQVSHDPKEPASGQLVRIAAKVTDADGVAEVTLQYQPVDPGDYIELSDAIYQTKWVSVLMNDAGRDGDIAASDGTYTAELPASLQINRRLMRYRITARDTVGRVVTVPYADDPEPNFAYFVYDGAPPWSGAIQPNGTDPAKRQLITYGTNVTRRLPVYHLLSKKASVEQATWIERYGGDLYKWKGTLVYDGKVYDHIRYRARGGVWRYSMGKNMWKFDFNRGHSFQARDNYGKKYKTSWTKLNLGACIQQADYLHRGEQGMFESVGFRLFNLAGLEGPLTHFIQFRIIDESAESDPANQYHGDLWGLYLAVEQEDSRFLDEHNLPDGNFYKMEGGTGELNNQGSTAVTDKSDLSAFLNTFRGAAPSDNWWRTNFNLQKYYSYQAIVQGIHHYDICEGKNYFYYRNPETGIWSVHPWDIDLTWADNMYNAGCGGTDEFKNRVLQRPAFNLEYKNRVREIRDLLFNSDQTFQLIDEYAAIIDDPMGGPSVVDLDRALWDYNPIMVSSYVLNYKAGQGKFYQIVPTKDFPGMLKKMKDYVNTRGALLDNLAQDTAVPAQPTVTYSGPLGFPANRLTFRVAPYSGANAFAALKWRMAEVAPANGPAFDPSQPRKYEINAVWESPEQTTFKSEAVIPPNALEVGHTYRVRVRMQDATGRWSHWSEPVQFVAAEPDNTQALIDHLRLTELMYNPPAGNDFEFIELHNTSTTLTLDLNGVVFTRGIDFVIGPGTSLAPGGYLLIAKAENTDNFKAFRTYYNLDSTVAIVAPYSGSLANEGERVTVTAPGHSQDLIDFTYSDQGSWPPGADGAGYSLVPLDLTLATPPSGSLSDAGNWRASKALLGSPGQADVSVGIADADGDGMPDEWETTHGLNPNSNSDAIADADADGLTNLQEFLSGTDPRDVRSALKLEASSVSGGGVVLRFTAMAGRSYTVQSRTDLSSGSWSGLADVDRQTTTRVFEINDAMPAGGSFRFYRLVTPKVAR